MEDRVIPANLHFQEPNPDIPALADDRLKVVTEPTPWNGGLVAINSFGFGGTNVHAVLKSNSRKADQPMHEAAEKKRLLICSSRTQEGLDEILALMTQQPQNVELQALLTESASIAPSSQPYRGYAVLNTDASLQEAQVSRE